MPVNATRGFSGVIRRQRRGATWMVDHTRMVDHTPPTAVVSDATFKLGRFVLVVENGAILVSEAGAQSFTNVGVDPSAIELSRLVDASFHLCREGAAGGLAYDPARDSSRARQTSTCWGDVARPSRPHEMKRVGHFPMAENRAVLRRYLMPVLERLRFSRA
jgi:hypothetical protein